MTDTPSQQRLVLTYNAFRTLLSRDERVILALRSGWIVTGTVYDWYPPDVEKEDGQADVSTADDDHADAPTADNDHADAPTATVLRLNAATFTRQGGEQQSAEFVLVPIDDIVLIAKSYRAGTSSSTPPPTSGAHDAASDSADRPADETSSAKVAQDVPGWAQVSDANLTLAGYRIELEKQLARLAREFDIPQRARRTPQATAAYLAKSGIIARTTADGVKDLIAMADQGVHGARVDPRVKDILEEKGRPLLAYLTGKHRESLS